MRFLANSLSGENGGRPDADVLAIPEINSLPARVRAVQRYVGRPLCNIPTGREKERSAGRMKETEGEREGCAATPFDWAVLA